jgi:hypothetical protein
MLNETIFVTVFLAIIAGLSVWSIRAGAKTRFLKKYGKKVTGKVVNMAEIGAYRRDRLGGNIYSPTVQFTTLEGQQITGKPVTGFTSQQQINAGFYVTVYYNALNAKEFCIEL